MQLSLRSELGSRILKSLALTCLLILPAIMGASPRIFGDGDVSWHIAAGNWILEHGRVPTTDPFSYTMFGQPWVAFEWLSEIIYAGAFNLAGYRGLSLVVTLALFTLNAVAFNYLFRKVSPLGLVCALAALDIVLSTFFYARPHVLVWPVLAFWTATLIRCRDEQRPPPLMLAAMMVLWVNLHASFLLGFVVAGAIGLDALIDARWSRSVLWDWVKFGAVILAAAFINANGPVGVIHPFNVMRLETLSLISEWNPSTPHNTPKFYAILLMVFGLVLLKGPRLKPGETLLLLFLLFMAFSQLRHQSWLAIVAVIVLTPRLSGRQEPEQRPFITPQMRPMAVTVGLVAVMMLVGRMIWPIHVQESPTNPRTLIAHIPAGLRSKPVFNDYSFGGPLILAGIRPYIDGRSEMYGDKFVSEYYAMQEGDVRRFDQTVRKYGIAWTVLPRRSKLARALDASAGWRRIYVDEVGVVHVRQGPRPEVY